MFTKTLSLFFLAFLFCSSSFATFNPDPNCTFAIGGRCFTRAEYKALRMLKGDVPTSGVCTSLRQVNDSAGFLTIGNGFRVDAVRCKSQGTAIKCKLAYIDNDSGYNSGTCTNIRYPLGNGAVEYGQATSVIDGPVNGANGATSSYGEAAYPYNTGFLIPTGKYLAVLAESGSAVFIEVWGHDEP